MLSVNGVASSAIVGHLRAVHRHDADAIVIAVLLLSGCLRSLHFTALNAISLADIAPPDMSQATSISSMAQRLSQSVGIAVGAYLLQISSALQGHAALEALDFWPVFVAIALISMVAPLIHLRLSKDAGLEVSGHMKA